ncbi:hypothetical protein BU14_0109s0023 [Porphyra umbilicalis]|uniref:Uncharacterized protein n=1 Tax=Porphyra umbilicalis TaxID=2786 RepID=A0A1X6PCP9_PORUM|nr:hypothetical protein BU14_0109s0023 [Porphyra umbilicalis]|eukprot:OSX78423.1 hypothetical protein BU14_0109s0023 [Porphyra umbilicalis]
MTRRPSQASRGARGVGWRGVQYSRRAVPPVVLSVLRPPPRSPPLGPTPPRIRPAAPCPAVAAGTAGVAPLRFSRADAVTSALPDASGAADAAEIASQASAAAPAHSPAPPGACVSPGGCAAAAGAARSSGGAGQAAGSCAGAVAAPLARDAAAGAGRLAVATDVPPQEAAAVAAAAGASSSPTPDGAVAHPMPCGFGGGSGAAVVAAAVPCPPTLRGRGSATLPADGASRGVAPPRHVEGVPVAVVVGGAPWGLSEPASARTASVPCGGGAAAAPRSAPPPPRPLCVGRSGRPGRAAGLAKVRWGVPRRYHR